MAQRSADDRAAGGRIGVRAATESPGSEGERERHGRPHQAVVESAGAAVQAGVDPASEAAREIVDDLVLRMSQLYGTTDGPRFRAQLTEMIGTFTDRRVERYWELLAIMNGCP